MLSMPPQSASQMALVMGFTVTGPSIVFKDGAIINVDAECERGHRDDKFVLGEWEKEAVEGGRVDGEGVRVWEGGFLRWILVGP